MSSSDNTYFEICENQPTLICRNQVTLISDFQLVKNLDSDRNEFLDKIWTFGKVWKLGFLAKKESFCTHVLPPILLIYLWSNIPLSDKNIWPFCTFDKMVYFVHPLTISNLHFLSKNQLW